MRLAMRINLLGKPSDVQYLPEKDPRSAWTVSNLNACMAVLPAIPPELTNHGAR